jgi:hypothetical protein
VLLCLSALGAMLLGRPPVAAASPVGAASPIGALGAAPSVDDTTDPAQPVSIQVSRFEPRTVSPGSTVTVSGTLTNTGDQTITELGVRLQRGAVMTTRAALVAADSDADPDTTVVPAFQNIPGRLDPHGSLPFTYAIASDDLQLNRDGVYPVLLNVNGTGADGARRRVGDVATYLVQQPAIPAGRTTVAWLWPIAERTHRTASGGFADDALATSISSGGRLDRALAVVEGLPKTTPAGGANPVPAVPVTLAVDPALVEELQIMAAGPYAVAGQAGAGQGTQSAQSFLDRLRALAAVHPVVALPYGDVDADALVTAGMNEILTRSLPGTPAGTAAATPAGTTPTTTGSSPPAGTGGGNAKSAGARILAGALHVDPRTDLAWLADGQVHPETVTELTAGGASQVVLGADALSRGGAALGLTRGTADARTTVTTSSRSVDALVADPGLGTVAGATDQTAGGVRIAEQRYLAELSLLSLQAPADPALAPTVLVAPPRDVVASPDGAGAMMSDTAELAWLRPATVQDLATGPVGDAGSLLAPTTPTGLDPAGLADVAAAVAVRDDLAGAVVNDPATAMAGYDAAVARTVSVSFRGDTGAFRTAASRLHDFLAGLRKQVTLLVPADGTYSLASSDAPLVLTVRNDLPFAVRVLLQLRTRGNVGLAIDDNGPQNLAPGERTTLQVPTHVRQSGRFAVSAALTTPSGGPLGERVDIQVQSTAYGWISLLITIGAAALLGLLFLRRLVRFVLKRRRRGPTDEGPGRAGPEGAAVPLPPTRSPV